LSRTLAQDASFVGTILMPYFLSISSTEAITTEAQSVSGMNPTFTSFFSGASEPAAQAAVRTASGTRLMIAAAPARLIKVRRAPLASVSTGFSFIRLSGQKTKKGVRMRRACMRRVRTPSFSCA
jgi:hypothetical protein